MAETVSHHLLRRTARARRTRLVALQRAARGSGIDALIAQDTLRRLDVSPSDRLVVTAAKRGPWRWRVERIAAGD